MTRRLPRQIQVTRVSFLCRVSGLNCREGLKSSDTRRELRVVPLCFSFLRGGEFVGFGIWLCCLHRFGTDIWTNFHGWTDSSACVFNKLHAVLFFSFPPLKKFYFHWRLSHCTFFFQPSHLMRLCTLETVHVKSHSKLWTKRQPPLERFHRVVSPVALLEPGSK